MATVANGGRREGLDAYWAEDVDALALRLETSPSGLTQPEAAARLRDVGLNQLRPRSKYSRAALIWAQLRSPLLLILVFAAVVSAISGAWIDASTVADIVLASVAITYSREYRAQMDLAALQAKVKTRTTAVRDGRSITIPVEEVAPGDVVLLSAGSLVPADGIIYDATDFFVSEAVLTGESFPAP
jgi:P-type Mg2+ transporter